MSQNLSGTRNIISFLLIAATLLVFVYLSSNPHENKLETIAIGVTQWPGFEYLFISKEQEFFKQAGLNIELVELSSLADVRRAFERGKIDGMASTLVEVLEAYKYSEYIAQPVLVTDYSEGADEILASNQLTTFEDLQGKKIGIEAGSFSSYFVSRALELNNMEHSDVTIIPMQTHKLPKALKTGKVDAITSYIPASLTIKKELDVNVIFDSSLIPHKLLDVVAINKEMIRKYPDLRKRLSHAWELTLDYAKNNPEESFVTLTERLPISVEEFKKSMRSIHLVYAEQQNDYLDKDGILEGTLKKVGEIIFTPEKNKEVDYSIFLPK